MSSSLRLTALVKSKKKKKKRNTRQSSDSGIQRTSHSLIRIHFPSSHWTSDFICWTAFVGFYDILRLWKRINLVYEYFTCYGRWNVTNSECSIVTVDDFLHFLV